MISVVIKGADVRRKIIEALPLADLIELRLDLIDEIDLQKIRAEFSIPMIFTVRGGYEKIKWAASFKPEYIDLDHNTSLEWIQAISPEIKVILSHHDFEKTPEDLPGLFAVMQNKPAYFYKIAVQAQNTLDALRLMDLVGDNLIAISMGSYGQMSRILKPAPIHYAALNPDETCASGQLTALELREKYRLNAKDWYGLIGDPVDGSISDVTHNQRLNGFDAVYVKMPVALNELSSFLTWARKMPFKGLSVTMPLKELVLSLIDFVDPEATEIGAVNTLKFDKGKIYGFNTDGKGALEALGPVKNKHVAILGAGGAAKAIAYEAIKREAKVTLVNRDQEKARLIAERFQCKSGHLAEYDILINCTPLQMPVREDQILPNSIVMDTTITPPDTLLLQTAATKNCQVINGRAMFERQANRQFNIWLGMLSEEDSTF